MSWMSWTFWWLNGFNAAAFTLITNCFSWLKWFQTICTYSSEKESDGSQESSNNNWCMDSSHVGFFWSVTITWMETETFQVLCFRLSAQMRHTAENIAASQRCVVDELGLGDKVSASVHYTAKNMTWYNNILFFWFGWRASLNDDVTTNRLIDLNWLD